ncbi:MULTISPECIES: CapA family protein [Flavobacteriaceae]|uniref:CapA family protein n=2 Tax=Flavobacteriaceae TaxID=49546 RepID=A0A4Y8AYD1_9FLAO|nr:MULTISPECIES: CapA family protein [Flavobacteriaceae]TEW77025.1 CapA family protein [Gramella jeungdoensis]GGK60662.1 hypothetical protein GCM10007963_30910 [Lutibacter litoralis]
MKISFVGDISFNDEYIDLYSKEINPFEGLSFLNESDFVVGNLECLVKGSEGENTLKEPRLKTEAKTLNWLKDLNISHVSLANNHVYDNLDDGFIKTINKLNELNIDYFGAEVVNEPKKYCEISKDGITIGILNYVDQDTNPCKPEITEINTSYIDNSSVGKDIELYKKECDILVLYLHWGGKSENIAFPERNQIRNSKDFLNLGADIIIGHHSHTIQPFMSSSKGNVYYSIGNFCFADSTIKESMIQMTKENNRGLILTLEIDLNKRIRTTKTFIQRLSNGKIIINNRIRYKYKLRSKFFAFISFCLPFLINTPIIYNKYFKIPFMYLLKGNMLDQMKKIDKKKLKNYLK